VRQPLPLLREALAGAAESAAGLLSPANAVAAGYAAAAAAAAALGASFLGASLVRVQAAVAQGRACCACCGGARRVRAAAGSLLPASRSPHKGSPQTRSLKGAVSINTWGLL